MNKILLIDDRATVQRGLRRLLSLDNNLFTIGETYNGLRAVEVCSEIDLDLVIWDTEMPIFYGH